MPAAVVIPAPTAYFKVVAVKKARSWISVEDDRSALWVCMWLSLDIFLNLTVWLGPRAFVLDPKSQTKKKFTFSSH